MACRGEGGEVGWQWLCVRAWRGEVGWQWLCVCVCVCVCDESFHFQKGRRPCLPPASLRLWM